MDYIAKIIEINGGEGILLPNALVLHKKLKAGDTLICIPSQRGILLCTEDQFLRMRTAGKPARMKRFR